MTKEKRGKTSLAIISSFNNDYISLTGASEVLLSSVQGNSDEQERVKHKNGCYSSIMERKPPFSYLMEYSTFISLHNLRILVIYIIFLFWHLTFSPQNFLALILVKLPIFPYLC